MSVTDDIGVTVICIMAVAGVLTWAIGQRTISAICFAIAGFGLLGIIAVIAV